MRLIESKAEYLPQGEGIEGIFKQIEIAGRTCYKSEEKITEDSAKAFVERMINSNHTAMLEHGTVYLAIPASEWVDNMAFMEALYSNPYVKINESKVDWGDMQGTVYVTTNLRVIVENKWWDYLKFICRPTLHHPRRYTFRFTTDRGVSHEIVRHRVMSFAQESTRYCNYSKDKFGNECTFIQPSWWKNANVKQKGLFKQVMLFSENSYITLLGQWDDRKADRRFKTGFKDNPLTPQQARQVLPNALKTEIVVTGFDSDWKHFFDLRYFGTTGAPHPDMKLLAEKAVAEAKKFGIWDYIHHDSKDLPIQEVKV